MGKLYKNIFCGTLLAAMSVVLSSCINEDMSDCGNDYKITYRMNLSTGLDTEIEQTLTSTEEMAFAPTLRAALSNVFTDYAYDNDLSFYVNGSLTRHEANEMNGNSASYTIYLSRNDYRHIALANTKDETQVKATGQDKEETFALQQLSADTIDSHNYGLFTARKDIAADDFGKDINVNLYMANCAVAVLINQSVTKPEKMMGYANGMTTDFNLNDSTYSTRKSTAVRARSVYGSSAQSAGSRYDALYAVTFPSKESQWSFDVIVLLNGKYTLTTLTVKEPLKAGQLKIIKAMVKEDGSLTTETRNVGATVKLDWKPGGNYDGDI